VCKKGLRFFIFCVEVDVGGGRGGDEEEEERGVWTKPYWAK
jgi:hypothetical protein